jgi:uncharacterized surface protein with fasciclin (FAS1) repeats
MPQSGATAGERASSTKPRKSIVEALRSSKGLRSFAKLVDAAGMATVLEAEGPFTVLVPTEAAFANLGEGAFDRLVEQQDRDRLRTIVSNHILRGGLGAADLADRSGVRSLADRRLAVEHKFGVLTVGRAAIKAANIPATNGIIHTISGVLQPVESDLMTVAGKVGPYATLIELIESAGLRDSLAGKGPYSLFAPTNRAFERLPAGTLDRLRDPAHRKELIELLRRHIVPGRIYAEDALRAGRLTNLNGEVLSFRLMDGRETLAGAHVYETNVDAGNGVLHAIDRVLVR